MDQKEYLRNVLSELIDGLPDEPLGNYSPRYMTIEVQFKDAAHNGLSTTFYFQ